MTPPFFTQVETLQSDAHYANSRADNALRAVSQIKLSELDRNGLLTEHFRVVGEQLHNVASILEQDYGSAPKSKGYSLIVQQALAKQTSQLDDKPRFASDMFQYLLQTLDRLIMIEAHKDCGAELKMKVEPLKDKVKAILARSLAEAGVWLDTFKGLLLKHLVKSQFLENPGAIKALLHLERPA